MNTWKHHIDEAEKWVLIADDRRVDDRERNIAAASALAHATLAALYPAPYNKDADE